MSDETILKGKKVYFSNEKLPYNVMAVSERYAVVSRKLNRREDAELLHHEVKMGAYCSFTEAYNANKDNPVYSLIDLKEKNSRTTQFSIRIFRLLQRERLQKGYKMAGRGQDGIVTQKQNRIDF